MCLKSVFVLFFGLSASAGVCAARSVPSSDGELPTITLDGPVKITHSVRIAPGVYRLPVPDGSAVIEAAADNVVLDLTGVTIESGARNPWDRVGMGIHSKGHSHISIQGGTVRGYRFNICLEGEAGTGSDIKVEGVDLSRSRAQRLLSTETHFDVLDWVNIFDLDAWESYGAGLYLKNLDDAWVERVNAHDAQNAILIARTTRATVYQSDLSRNSGWGIALYGSSRNNLLNNHADWNVRCEGKSYSAGCDSAGILLMEGSNYNRIVGNSFTHSGDGYFLSKSPQGSSSDSNYVAFNDGSYSPHNSFESVFTAGDQFYHNVARHSDYGFWLSFSRDTTVIDNDIEGSRHDGIAVEHGENNSFLHNRISSSMASGIRLFRSGGAPEPSRGYAIISNVFTGNKVAVLVNRTEDVTLQDNEFVNNSDGIKVEEAGPGIRSAANRFTPPQQ
jgi:parallel beta-helix repeat protein